MYSNTWTKWLYLMASIPPAEQAPSQSSRHTPCAVAALSNGSQLTFEFAPRGRRSTPLCLRVKRLKATAHGV
ncbi:MAG TPA: hypothetical protein VG125_02795, partial [Pirellulales bacterium]|nr:hypothetical protein [Pirellulales bacterium]